MRLARIYLGVLLSAMALGQLVSLGDFVDALQAYDVGPGAALAAVLMAFELGGAIGLLAPVETVRRAGALAGVAAASLGPPSRCRAWRVVSRSTTAGASGGSSPSR